MMNYEQLSEALKTAPTKEVKEAAYNWIIENEDKYRQRLFFDLLAAGIDGELFDRLLKWIYSDIHSNGGYLSRLLKHAPDAIKQKLIDEAIGLVKENNNDDKLTYLASQLILDHKCVNLIPWAKNWLDKHFDSTVSGFLVHSLISVQSDNDTIALAQNWFKQNSNHWHSNMILADLITHCPNRNNITEAIQRLNEKPEFELFLAIAPLVRTGKEATNAIIDWLSRNSDHPNSGMYLYECFNEYPEMFLEAMSHWLDTNKKPSEPCYLQAKEWLESNPDHPYASKIAKGLNHE